MSKPDFLCIGAQKAGTTWLDSQLRSRDDVWMPPMKEVHYFDHVHREDFRKWIKWHLKITMRREIGKLVDIDKKEALNWKQVNFLSNIMLHKEKFTDDWYSLIFSGGGFDKIKGEITPEYSCIGEEGVKHILRVNPGVKIIYIIRDPIARAWSQLKMNMMRNGSLKPHLIKKGGIDHEAYMQNIDHPSILDRGNYLRNVPIWDKHFVEDKNILYVAFSEIKSSPVELMKKVERFIGLSYSENYDSAHKVVHKGASLSMPEFVNSAFEDMFKEQYQFLTERFGKDFVSKI